MKEHERIITLDEHNLATEHICCAIADKKCLQGYSLKKDWLGTQFRAGHVFKRLDVRHKVFIEYVPAEAAWSPVTAPGYLAITCFWVAGSYKGKGHGRRLLDECLEDARGMNGAVVVSSDKKRPFLADKKFFLKQGFSVCDTAPPYFELLVKKNIDGAPDPRFNAPAKKCVVPGGRGIQVYYSHQCPYTEYYANVELKRAVDERGMEFSATRIRSTAAAKKNPSACTVFSVFHDGAFLTHEILTAKRFDALMKERRD